MAAQPEKCGDLLGSFSNQSHPTKYLWRTSISAPALSSYPVQLTGDKQREQTAQNESG